jgi:hypothetical protein
MLANLMESITMTMGNSRCLMFIDISWDFQKIVVVVRGYIIGDATYPIWPYLQKN